MAESAVALHHAAAAFTPGYRAWTVGGPFDIAPTRAALAEETPCGAHYVLRNNHRV